MFKKFDNYFKDKINLKTFLIVMALAYFLNYFVVDSSIQIILTPFFLYAFLRGLYYVFVESKDKNLIFRSSLGLFSFIPLLLTLHFLSLVDLRILLRKYKIIYDIYITLTWFTFVIGGYLSAKTMVDPVKRKEIYKSLAFIVIGTILYLYF